MSGVDEIPEESDQWQEEAGDEAPLPDLPLFIDLLRRRCGTDFAGYKTSTLTRRIRRRIACENADSVLAYHARIVEDATERDALCRDLLIHVTEFFRDPDVFALLADEVFPDLLRGRDPSDDLRIWSAGCATGEEAYSLAMLALDAASRFGFHGNVKVFATDLHSGVIGQASQGLYADEAVQAIPEQLLRRYFQRDGKRWRVDGSLRRHIVFARHNLLTDPPFTRIDLAACRNLLIYLQPAAQLKALAQLHFALKPQGLLLLGSSETVGEYEDRAFSVGDRSRKLFRKLTASLPHSSDAIIVPDRPAVVPTEPEPADLRGQPTEVLEAELISTRERLQEMICELQASHERIDLANEELTASNEELQSTNEELKSVNEDLCTLNAELEQKNQALAQLNRDYDQLLASAEIGTLFLDVDMRVRRFSAAISPFLGLRPQDVGRPIEEITYRAGDAAIFLANLSRVATEGGRIEREVALDKRWFLERILPFRGESGHPEGVVLTYTEITEVKAAQARADALAAERTRLQNILDALPDGVYIVSRDHEIEYLNPALERTFGPIAGRKCHEYFHGLSSECDWCKNDRVFAGETVRWEWTAPNGRSYELFDMPFRNPDGSISKFEIFHDITPVRDTEQRLSEATSLAHVGHWEWRPQNDELRWSAETYRIFGYAPYSITPSFELFLTHVDPDERERVREAVSRSLAEDSAYLCEFGFFRCDGTSGIGRASGRIVRKDDGTPLVMSGAMQDITELRRMEDALHANEQLFSATFQGAPHAAVITRVSDGCIIAVNDRFERLFGWTAGEIIGRNAVDAGQWADAASWSEWLDELQAAGALIDQETVWKHRDGGVRHVSLSAQLAQIHGDEHILLFIRDLTERKAAEERIDYLANHDTLTGLPNRVLFRDRFDLATAWAERSASKVALLFLDLDHFKTINDTLGHPVGDTLLKLVADRLRSCVRDTDTISRLGGDEFLIALTDVRSPQSVNLIADKILEMLGRPFRVEEHDLTNTLSIGIALWPDDGTDFDTLLKKADTALYQAKAAGRNTCRFYTEQMNQEALERLQIRTALHCALEQNEFLLHYQPQIDLASGRILGVETLLRWNRNGTELVPPGRFIPAAEESGLIVPIGDWVLREACRQAAQWQTRGLPPMTVAVNLSAVQFRRGQLEHSVSHALAYSGLDPALLELELTESLLLDDTDEVLATAQRLKALGVHLSIDDFGTGYSSLAYLKRFKVDKLKIDQSFVRDIATDPEDAAIVRAIINMARSLKLQVIAEGVESEEIARYLGIFQCDQAQGYHYARPMAAADLEHWIARYQAKDGRP
ncbi:MAG: EAL domain-containing protein [Rhodocyclaceae bacterium]|nr:EAL domain-containing protein [Rhodocyclaceae bacterium]